MHAGAGEGIALPQLDFFREDVSFPTATLATRLSDIVQGDVILCERKVKERQQLTQKFPHAVILADHADIPEQLGHGYDWALVLNDPCGYSEHGIETMQQIASQVATDWLIVFNEGSLMRILGMRPVVTQQEIPFVARVRAARALYAWMAEPQAWAARLRARHMARTVLIPASDGFRYRIFVLSRMLSDAVKRVPWEIVL